MFFCCCCYISTNGSFCLTLTYSNLPKQNDDMYKVRLQAFRQKTQQFKILIILAHKRYDEQDFFLFSAPVKSFFWLAEAFLLLFLSVLGRLRSILYGSIAKRCGEGQIPSLKDAAGFAVLRNNRS